MKILTVAITGILAFGLEQTGLGCSCSPVADNFFSTVSKHNEFVSNGSFPESLELTVVTGTVVQYNSPTDGGFPTEMMIEVSDVLQGKLTKKRIVVEGDNGFSCRPYVSEFPVGKKFAFALSKAQVPTVDYEISICGVYAKSID